jgi:hypothetical protein
MVFEDERTQALDCPTMVQHAEATDLDGHIRTGGELPHGPRGSTSMQMALVSVYVGSTAVGQGLETVMTQIAADTLGLPLGKVRVLHGSTPFLDEGYGAFALRSTSMASCEIQRASQDSLTFPLRKSGSEVRRRRPRSPSPTSGHPRRRRARSFPPS